MKNLHVTLSSYVFLFLLLIINSFCGCSAFNSIQNYNREIDVKPDVNNTIVLTPAPQNVTYYDSTISVNWERTYNHCAQVKKAVLKELGERTDRVASRKTLLLSIGGLSSLANAIYSGVKDTPNKNVTIPLSIISGTALLSFLPSLIDDDRVELLRQKIKNLNDFQVKAELAMINLDKNLTEKALLEYQFNNTDKEKDKEKIRSKIDDLIRELDKLTGILKMSLLDWSNEAQ